MGLDTSHGCWRGAYSAFMRWRLKLAEVAGVPLMLMEGFYEPPPADAMVWAAPGDNGQRPICSDWRGPMLHRWAERFSVGLPIRWDALKPDPLHVLLSHSDCDGEIAAADCGPLADRLEQLLPLLPEGGSGGHIADWREKTQTFIDGLRRAAAAGEPVDFH